MTLQLLNNKCKVLVVCTTYLVKVVIFNCQEPSWNPSPLSCPLPLIKPLIFLLWSLDYWSTSMVGPKKKDFWPKITMSFINWNYPFNKKCAHKRVKMKKNLDHSWNRKVTLKVKFWHFLTICHSCRYIQERYHDQDNLFSCTLACKYFFVFCKLNCYLRIEEQYLFTPRKNECTL